MTASRSRRDAGAFYQSVPLSCRLTRSGTERPAAIFSGSKREGLLAARASASTGCGQSTALEGASNNSLLALTCGRRDTAHVRCPVLASAGPRPLARLASRRAPECLRSWVPAASPRARSPAKWRSSSPLLSSWVQTHARPRFETLKPERSDRPVATATAARRGRSLAPCRLRLNLRIEALRPEGRRCSAQSVMAQSHLTA
jgi:hypothetical protein